MWNCLEMCSLAIFCLLLLFTSFISILLGFFHRFSDLSLLKYSLINFLRSLRNSCIFYRRKIGCYLFRALLISYFVSSGSLLTLILLLLSFKFNNNFLIVLKNSWEFYCCYRQIPTVFKYLISKNSLWSHNFYFYNKYVLAIKINLILSVDQNG